MHGEPPQRLPLSLPLAHFALVAVWFGLAGGALVLVAPDLAAGNIFAPRVFAVTHLLTLGVVTTAVFGALYQFIPAVLGVPVRSSPVAWTGLPLLALGTAALVAGFWRWGPWLQGAGWILVFAAVGCSSWNVLPARRRASRNRIIGLYVTLGHSWLGFALAIAVARIGSSLGWWHTDRAGLVAAHFHDATLGFATTTVVGIGGMMIPGFLGSKGHSNRPLRWIGWVSSAGLVLFSIGTVFAVPPLALPGAGLMLTAAVAHLTLVASYYRHSGPRRLDPGLGFIAVAFGFLAAAVITGTGLFFSGRGPSRGWAVYAILALQGWLAMIVLGVMHRVVPRLVAQHIAARRMSRTTAEGRADLLSVPLGWAALVLLAVGTAGLAAAVAAGSRLAATVASTLYAAGAAVLLAQAARLVRLARA